MASLVALFASCARPDPVAQSDIFPASTIAGARIRDWQELPDFAALRNEYGDRDDYYDLCDQSGLKNAVALFNAEEWLDLEIASNQLLFNCPVDIDLHYLRTVALSELSREAEAAVQSRWYHGLVDSVLDTGDGLSAESAWVVISVSEEYSILRALGAEARGQGLVDGGVDAITVEYEGETNTFYFRPEAHFRRLMKALGP